MRARAALTALALAAAAFLAYLPALRAGFIWDDDAYLTGSPLLKEPGSLRRIWTTASPPFQPVVYTMFWFEKRLWGLDPLGFHAVNVALHVLNAFLVVALARRLGLPGPWLIGFLFALHPVQVETVAWVTSRKTVLSGTLYLLALACFLRQEDASGRERWRWHLGAHVLFILAMLAKSVVATFPAALLVIRWWRGRRVDRAFLLSLLPFLLIGACLGLRTARLEIHEVGAHGPEWALSFYQRLVLAGRALAFYPRKLLWPSDLCFTYATTVPHPFLSPEVLWPLGALLAGGAAWLARDWMSRGLPAALGFFAATIFPALGFFNVYYQRYSFVTDHYQYLACLGLIVLGVGALVRLGKVLKPGPVFKNAATILLLGTLAVLTFRQSRIYRDGETLWRDTLAKNPGAWIAHDCLGKIEVNNHGNVDRAIGHYEAALTLKPDDFFAHNALGILLMRLDRPGEALPHLLEAARLVPDPSYDEPWQNLERFWRDMARKDPAHPAPVYNLGVALAKLGRRDEADACFHKALELDPGFAPAKQALAPHP